MYSILKKYGFTKNFNIEYEELQKKKNNNVFQLLMDDEGESGNEEEEVKLTMLYKVYNKSWF